MTGAASSSGLTSKRVVVADGTTVVRVVGELDLATTPDVAEAPASLAAEGRRTLLDLSGVSCMDSTGIKVLIEASSRSERVGWTFAIADNLQDPSLGCSRSRLCATAFPVTGGNRPSGCAWRRTYAPWTRCPRRRIGHRGHRVGDDGLMCRGGRAVKQRGSD